MHAAKSLIFQIGLKKIYLKIAKSAISLYSTSLLVPVLLTESVWVALLKTGEISEYLLSCKNTLSPFETKKMKNLKNVGIFHFHPAKLHYLPIELSFQFQ